MKKIDMINTKAWCYVGTAKAWQNDDNSVFVWPYYGCTWIIQVENKVIFDQIKKWPFVGIRETYGVNYLMRQFVVPSKQINRVKRLLGIPLVKKLSKIVLGNEIA